MDISVGALIRRTEWMPETYCGARPKSRAENTRDMTPKKKLIFSRVRTTFADCHAADSDPIRVETYNTNTWQLTRSIHEATYLQLQPGDLALEILGEEFGAWRFPFEDLIKSELCAHLESVLAPGDVALQQVHPRIPVRLQCVCGARSSMKAMRLRWG
jgi:hypothetical protein